MMTGEYQVPLLKTVQNQKIGKYGMMRKEFLKTQRNPMYQVLIATKKLTKELLKYQEVGLKMEQQNKTEEQIRRIICQ